MKALLVTLDKCPNLDAGAVRVHMYAKMLREYGYDVSVVSMGPYTDFKPIIEEEIEYTSFRKKRDDKFSKAVSYLLFAHRLKIVINRNKYDVIIHTQVDKASLKVLFRYSKLHGIPIVYDSVEWFSPEQFKKGEKSKAYILNDNYNTKYINKSHKVVTISSYLYNHFKNRQIDTIRIPVVLDVEKISNEKKAKREIIKIIYAGAPGKKDYLDVVVEALARLKDQERNKLQLIVIGCDKDQFVNNSQTDKKIVDSISKFIDFRGRIRREEVLEAYSEADFSVLIRSTKQRYAKAGFPTKMVESLSTGTPIICNCTSDIADYIVDMENGIIVDDESVSACEKALRRVIDMKQEEIRKIQVSARRLAEECFDYKKYSESLVRFIER